MRWTAVVKGAEGPQADCSTPAVIKPQHPDAVRGVVTFQRCQPGDLDGDGQYASAQVGNPPVTEMPASGSVFLDGYKWTCVGELG